MTDGNKIGQEEEEICMLHKVMYFFDDGQTVGGAINTLLQQAILVRQAGYETVLVISNRRQDEIGDRYHNIYAKCGMRVLRLPFSISNQPEDIDIVHLIEHYEEVRDAVKGYAPDILHSVQINPMLELISRELNIPHIMNVYPLIPAFYSIDYMDVFPRFHICDSNYYAEQWKRYFKTDSICIRTVVYKLPSIKRHVAAKKEIRYLCVGTVYKEKNQLEVIKAFHMALRHGAAGKLFVCGYATNRYAEECRRYIAVNDLEDCIFLKGFIEDMSVEYELGDVLICGSTRESYPNVISEALANGLVVISTPVAGVPEVIKDGFNGYLCEGYTKEAICDKIEQFDRERKGNRIAEILTNACNTFKMTHSPEVITNILLNYYQYVLKEPRRHTSIGIKKVKEEFLDIINNFNDKFSFFTSPEKVQLKLWYIYHIKNIVDDLVDCNEAEFFVWGTGKYAINVMEILDVFFPTLKVSGFVDSYKQGKFLELEISMPDVILQKKNSIIFVGVVNGQEEVIQTLEDYCRECNKDYFILAPRRW